MIEADADEEISDDINENHMDNMEVETLNSERAQLIIIPNSSQDADLKSSCSVLQVANADLPTSNYTLLMHDSGKCMTPAKKVMQNSNTVEEKKSVSSVSLCSRSKSAGKMEDEEVQPTADVKDKSALGPPNLSVIKSLSTVKFLQDFNCAFCEMQFVACGEALTHLKESHSLESQLPLQRCIDALYRETEVVCPGCCIVVDSIVSMEEEHLPKCTELQFLYSKRKRDGIPKTKESKIHLCHLCPSAFSRKSSLTEHMNNVHTQNKKDAFKCTVCGKGFATHRYLRSHIATTHAAASHVCRMCGKAFRVPANLRRHMHLVHEADSREKVKCEQCGKQFSLKANLKEHMNAVHQNIYRENCTICKLGFHTKNALLKHIQTFHAR